MKCSAVVSFSFKPALLKFMTRKSHVGLISIIKELHVEGYILTRLKQWSFGKAY